jgi:hypothetical protein
MFKSEHFPKKVGGILLPTAMKINLAIAMVSILIVMCFGVLQPAAAQTSNAPPIDPRPTLTAEQIVNNLVRRNLERARALSAYQGTRLYRLEYRGFPSSRSAEIIVDVEYRSPGTKEFSIRSEKGSHFLVERVFQRLLQSEKEALTEENQARVALNNDNYRFTLAGRESSPTGLAYILSVEPRTNNKLLYRGKIWVDAEDFAVVRIEAAPAKNPSFWTKETKIEQVYGKVGNFWLPVSNRSTSVIRLGGHADLTIDYQDYRIKAGGPLVTSGKITEY